LGGSFEYEPMGILDNTHLKYFTLQSFSELANETGYRVEAVDHTVSDYPKEIITRVLEQYGLTPNEAFWQMADTAEARTSQYKFILKPAAGKISQRELPVKQLPTKLDIHRDSFIEDLRTQAEVLHKHSEEQAKIIKHYFDLSQKLEAENKRLKSNLGYKVQQSIKRKKVQ